jgi:cytochrome c oxidase subunit 4
MADYSNYDYKMSQQSHEHIVPTRTFILVWIALLCLTVITAGVAYLDLGPFNTIVALTIATIKALMVVLIFMHVMYASDKLIKVIVISAVFWLMILLLLSLVDYAFRFPDHTSLHPLASSVAALL